MKYWQKIVGFLLIKLIYNLKVLGSKNTKNITRPILIVSNHKNILDSFALGAATPLRTNILPVKIMGATQNFLNPTINFLNKIGVIKLIYLMFDVFPSIKNEKLEKSLKEPIKFLKENKNVFMHPEGRVIYEKEIGQFKRGAPFLAKRTEVQILPVAFKIEKKRFRKTYYVNFGKTFLLPKHLTNERGAEYIRNIVVDLYKNIC